MNGWPRLTQRNGRLACDGFLPAIPPNPARAAPVGVTPRLGKNCTLRTDEGGWP